MGRKRFTYEEMLKTIKTDQEWFEPSPYQWKEMDYLNELNL